jgi:hypothetical protein
MIIVHLSNFITVVFRLLPAELYKNSRAEKTHEPFGLIQAEFLNFTNYIIFGDLSNLKIWRLPENDQTFLLAKPCAIFYIHLKFTIH